jgi:hypothetical protein
MIAGGAEFGKIKIRKYNDHHVGMHAKAPIKKGVTLAFIPQTRLLTPDLAK